MLFQLKNNPSQNRLDNTVEEIQTRKKHTKNANKSGI